MSRADIRAALQTDEGLRLRPYVDTVGKTTIGYGRNLTDNGISLREAALLLENDIDSAEHELTTRYLWTRELDPVRYGVLVQLMFNLGPTKFAGFRQMLYHAERGEWAQAAGELVRSKWYDQVGHNRARRLVHELSTGQL